jgi:hypothetical protein
MEDLIQRYSDAWASRDPDAIVARYVRCRSSGYTSSRFSRSMRSTRRLPAGSPRHADSTQRPARAFSQVIYGIAMSAQTSKQRQTPRT